MLLFESLSAIARWTTEMNPDEPKSEAQLAFESMMDMIDEILRIVFMAAMLESLMARPVQPAPVIVPIRPLPRVNPANEAQPAPGERKRFSMKDVQANRGQRIDAAREAEPSTSAAPITIRRLDLAERPGAGPTASVMRHNKPGSLDYQQDNGLEEYRPRRRFSIR
ncbi:hypothetical protein SAMN05216466_106221 [Paraburkholderia phenazinium]|uniref:Uncharacterized protein n=1 Tax=Paraburkholderia phenazinium TaxID=60549 RepID=A0A1G7YJP7_9BURK|nr:hypothetical protein [Paraburkholderia phenazinium]SDG96798.1 hypothetical protein SAMN05216466_106221 [Paraburkholderia phenazinium]